MLVHNNFLLISLLCSFECVIQRSCYRIVNKSLMTSLVLVTALLCGCGGGQSDLSSPPSTSVFESIRARLYAGSTAQLQMFSEADPMPDSLRVRVQKANHILAVVAPQAWDVWSISYRYTNLPQVSLLMRSPGNRRLMIYNHGHSGLPSPTDTFALEFLRDVHKQGHDILLTSMPLTGFNAPLSSESYFTFARTGTYSVTIAPQLLHDPFALHGLYELIGDPDHYLHYFLDGGLMPAFALSASSALSAIYSPPYLSENNFSFTLKKYSSIDYVGLSGGATTGLVSCAVHRFDRCILVAGVMPDHLRLSFSSNFGDAEQHTRSFYEGFPFDTVLHQAATSSLKLILIFNDRDTCCFSDPSATIFKNEYPNFDIRIERLNFHGYIAASLIAALNE